MQYKVPKLSAKMSKAAARTRLKSENNGQKWNRKRGRAEYICQFSYWNLSGGFLIRALLRRGDEPKVKTLLNFPAPLPVLTTRACPSRTPVLGVFASDLAFFGAEWRIERALALFVAVAPESCIVKGVPWQWRRVFCGLRLVCPHHPVSAVLNLILHWIHPRDRVWTFAALLYSRPPLLASTQVQSRGLAVESIVVVCCGTLLGPWRSGNSLSSYEILRRGHFLYWSIRVTSLPRPAWIGLLLTVVEALAVRDLSVVNQ